MCVECEALLAIEEVVLLRTFGRDHERRMSDERDFGQTAGKGGLHGSGELWRSRRRLHGFLRRPGKREHTDGQ
jgi:hypothetical protein